MKGRKQENFEDLMQKSKLHGKILNLGKKEMQIKATLKYHLTPTKLLFLKKMGWQGDSDIGTLIHFRWQCKLVLPLTKHYGNTRNIHAF